MYKFNLLPPELRPGPGWPRKKTLLNSIVILIILAVAGIYCVFYFHFLSTERELATIAQKLVNIAPNVEEVNAVREQRRQAEAAKAELTGLLRGQKSWARVLSGISSQVPENVWLTEMRIYYLPGVSGPVVEPERSAEKPRTITPLGNPDSGTAGDRSPNVLKISGKSFSVRALGTFLNRLEGLPDFGQVSLYSLSEKKAGVQLSFIIYARVRESES